MNLSSNHNFISNKKNELKLAAVIGDPISHSLSPFIHNFFLKKYQIEGRYEAVRLEKDKFLSGLQELVKQGFIGFNITIPHKESAISFCSKLSEAAKIIGAVNTISINSDKIYGDNSDSFGFLKNLENEQPDFSLKNKNVFLIGAGGASRAVIYALISKKVRKIFITNRSKEKAMKLIADFSDFAMIYEVNLEFLEIETFSKKLSICDLLINSTSLGMQGAEALKLNIDSLENIAPVYDLVYKPLNTELLNAATNRGNPVITGIGMLIEQAKLGFFSWFGIYPESDDMLTSQLIAKSKNL